MSESTTQKPTRYLRRSLIILGTSIFTSISFASFANPSGAQNRAIDAIKTKPRVPTADELIDRDRLRGPEKAECDIQISWKYVPAGQSATAAGFSKTALGIGATAVANGRYPIRKYIAAKPIFKNVGKKFCRKWAGESGFDVVVNGNLTRFGGVSYACARPLAPGAVCEGITVNGWVEAGQTGRGSQHFAWTKPLRFDRNQGNNTYRLYFKVE